MKTKLFAGLSLLMMFSLAGCGLIPAINDIIPSGGGEDSISDDYDPNEIGQKLNTLRVQSGYSFNYEIVTTDDGETDRTSLTYATKNDLYYFMDEDGDETYWDLTSETSYDVYSKNAGETVWGKETYNYEDYSTTKEEIRTITSTYVVGWFSYYSAYGDLGATKTQTTFLGRSCDKYTMSQRIVTVGATVSYSYECIIDQQLGVCFKWTFSASGATATESGSGSVNFECKAFSTNPTITLPVVA